MTQQWRSINDVGFSSAKKTEEPKQQKALTDDPAPKKDDPEVRFDKTEWKPGAKGFAFDEKCICEVRATFLKPTQRTKITADLHVKYNNALENLNQSVDANINDQGIAQFKVPLWYGDAYYKDARTKPDAQCYYILKNIRHTLGQNKIDSVELEMPAGDELPFVEIRDIHFNFDSAIPIIDEDEELIRAFILAIRYSQKNSDKELVICGHTDTSGKESYNMDLSEMRAKAIKAFFDNDADAFADIAQKKSNIEDYQHYLKIIAKNFLLTSDPGPVTNTVTPATTESVKTFQESFNTFYGGSLEGDGKVGKQTWKALFLVLTDFILSELQVKEMPKIKYGKGGKGIEAFGETLPLENKSDPNFRSKTNRRAELTFQDPQKVLERKKAKIKKIPHEEPKKNISGIKISCQHTKNDGNPRSISANQILEIVPDSRGDTITLSAVTSTPDISSTWRLSGYKNAEPSGNTAEVNVSGFGSQMQDFLLNIIMGDIKTLFGPKQIRVECIETDGKRYYGKINVYPNSEKSYEIDLSKTLKSFRELKKKFSKVCEFLGQEINIDILVGKVSVSGAYAEDKDGPLVYFGFKVKAGFSPLIGANTTIKFPLDGIASAIPQKLKKYIYEINAIFTLKGEVGLNGTIARVGMKKVECNGALSGSIGAGVGLHASIGNGKILDVKALIESSVTGEGKLFSECDFNQDKVGIFMQAKVEWDGLAGNLSWELFDGTFSGVQKMVILEPKTIWESTKFPFYESN